MERGDGTLKTASPFHWLYELVRAPIQFGLLLLGNCLFGGGVHWTLRGSTPNLVLTGISQADAGSYSVTVTNAVGAVVSSNALLTVFRVVVGDN